MSFAYPACDSHTNCGIGAPSTSKAQIQQISGKIYLYVNVNLKTWNQAAMTTVTYSISDLAKEFDLTTRAIRFYEDMGLLTPARDGEQGRVRVYSARDRARLKLTLRAKRLGLSLTEAKDIIDMYDSPRDTAAQLKKFLSVLTQHRSELEDRMKELQANLDEVRAHEKEAKALLAKSEKKAIR
jgi:DNA-binding transcriptional MerR regulator